MTEYSKSDHFLETLEKSGLPEKDGRLLKGFYTSYRSVIEKNGGNQDALYPLFCTYLGMVKKQVAEPFEFEPYHQKVTTPANYYQFGIDFLKPLIDMENSSIQGIEQLDTITSYIKQGDNVVLLANHQIEADPQAISVLTEKTHPQFADSLIFVAGDRVCTDPLAVPFSMGCNLLCIYSKKYIDNPPADKLKKQLHNKKTMQLMSALLAEGGHCIYVAPSGGRDRMNDQGKIDVAPFDPQSVEMFYLMAKRAKTKTHFFPLALSTYHILPPPKSVQVELGETRTTGGGPIDLSFGPELDMERLVQGETACKHELRQTRAKAIWRLVHDAYIKLPTSS